MVWRSDCWREFAFTCLGTPVYVKLHELLLRYHNSGGIVPPYGTIWMPYCPNAMLEWYLHVLVVSAALPIEAESCKNMVKFYYPEDIALLRQEFVKAEQAAYNETAEGDNTICKLMPVGHCALYTQSLNEAGPCLPQMEGSMAHFHKFMRQKIEVHILNFKFWMLYKTTISNVLLYLFFASYISSYF